MTNFYDRGTSDHIGGPSVCTEFKLVDIEEMNYLSTDNPPRGLIYLRGPSIIRDYFKNQKETNKILTHDGWLNTGDVGELKPNGALKIIDRKKNILKLSQGEYVAPLHLEEIYQSLEYIKEIYVYGDSLKSYLVAIVVPDWNNLVQLIK